MTIAILTFLFSLILLLASTPLIIITAVIIFLSDLKNPFYVSQRVGLNGKLFKLLKLRTMVVDAHISGVDTTTSDI